MKKHMWYFVLLVTFTVYIYSMESTVEVDTEGNPITPAQTTTPPALNKNSKEGGLMALGTEFLESMLNKPKGEGTSTTPRPTRPFPHLTIPVSIPGSAHSKSASPSRAEQVSERVAGRLAPQTLDELHTLVKKHSQTAPIAKRRRTLVESDEQKSEESSDHFNPLNTQNKNSLACSLAEKIYVDPQLLVEGRYKLHGEHEKSPRDYEVEPYEGMNSDKYERLVIELFKLMIEHNNKPSIPVEEETVPQKKDEFIDTHVGVLKRHIDQQETDIAQKRRYLFYSKILAFVQGLISTGLTIWATYSEVNCHNNGINNSTAT